MAFVNYFFRNLLTSLEEVTRELQDYGVFLATAPSIIAVAKFNGTVATPVFAAKHEMTGITKLGTGNYRLTLSQNMVGKHYGVHVACHDTGVVLVGQAYNKTETTVDVRVQTLGGVFTDSADCFVSVVHLPR